MARAGRRAVPRRRHCLDGACWFDALQATISGPLNVSNALIEQSPYEAIQWVEGTVNGVSLDTVRIIGTGTYALQDQSGASVTLKNVTATGVTQANLGHSPSYSCDSGHFVVTDHGGDSGILPTQCTAWPAPVYPPYPSAAK